EFLIDQKGVPGVVETVPTYRALLVYYDPSIVGYEALCAQLSTLAEQATTTAMPPAREVELPCCYEGGLGPDLEAAARRLELPVGLYDPDAAEPILLKPGDRVRFRRVERREFDDVAARVAAGRFRPVIR